MFCLRKRCGNEEKKQNRREIQYVTKRGSTEDTRSTETHTPAVAVATQRWRERSFTHNMTQTFSICATSNRRHSGTQHAEQLVALSSQLCDYNINTRKLRSVLFLRDIKRSPWKSSSAERRPEHQDRTALWTHTRPASESAVSWQLRKVQVCAINNLRMKKRWGKRHLKGQSGVLFLPPAPHFTLCSSE